MNTLFNIIYVFYYSLSIIATNQGAYTTALQVFFKKCYERLEIGEEMGGNRFESVTKLV